MFCVVNGKLLIARPNLLYSHQEWFEKIGWNKAQIKIFMASGLRGIIDANGNLNFYTGYDFKVTNKIEKEFFSALPNLVKKLKVKPSARILGGSIKGELGEVWPARKDYGSVKDFIKN